MRTRKFLNIAPVRINARSSVSASIVLESPQTPRLSSNSPEELNQLPLGKDDLGLVPI
jgi:hypothetical protein